MQSKPGGALTAVMVALTMTTGMVEAVSFLALGPVFTAMQTGNVLFLGFALVREGGLSAVASSVSLGAFAVGAVAGARLASRVDARQRRWFVVALFVEGALLVAAALAAWGLERAGGSPSGRHVVVIAMVALAMGVRNVTTLRAHVPDLPTTLVTRAMTAMISGSPLGHDTALGYGTGATARRAASVLAMFAGGLLGAWLIRTDWPPAGVLLLVAGSVVAIAVAYATAPRFGRPGAR
ncbi:DUF1275 domain-containing protein [Streptomyces sp. A3M-1-3]|uniref:YoaK family protein n=1 Tax=Streptomyces sp. A3M-1-3 TaxID=2962044 RepID=UPI0020B85FFF|nr:YoaK family protein [Streptomyces sp. A3M-1-3]MCP3820605.1 DUF1275 domain-containing protein [Streptomyces sp. A3M-1-3]